MAKKETVEQFWSSLIEHDMQRCIMLLKKSDDPGLLLTSPCDNTTRKMYSNFPRMPAYNQYPLSYMRSWFFSHKERDKFFTFMLDILPSVGNRKDSDGCFPLCHFLSGGCRMPGASSCEDFLSYLVQSNSAAVKCTAGHDLPLEIALHENFSAKLVLLLLENSPPSLEDFAVNPLRLALERLTEETLETVIEALVTKYPGASYFSVHDEIGNFQSSGRRNRYETRENGQHFPLHIAVKRAAGLKVIRTLLLAYPKAAAIPLEKRSEYLLHEFMTNQVTCPETGADEIINLLNKAWHEAFKIPFGSNRMLPLHWAIQNNMRSEVILSFLKACPQVAALRDSRSSWLPLHIAAAGRVSPEVMLALLEAYPQAVSKRVYKTIQGTQMSGWCCPIDLMQPSLPEASMQLLIEASSSKSNH